MEKIFIKNNSNFKKGFSLVEMLVAVGIFMSIMTIAVSSLISIIGANKKAQSIKTTIDSVTFAVENISRDMRMGNNYKCMIDSSFTNVGCDIGSKSVGYVNSSDQAVVYQFLDTGELIRKECTDKVNYTSASCNDGVDLISVDSGAKLKEMNFYVMGADKEDPSNAQALRTQPRVVITTSGLISVKGSTDTSFNLQTEISQRARN